MREALQSYPSSNRKTVARKQDQEDVTVVKCFVESPSQNRSVRDDWLDVNIRKKNERMWGDQGYDIHRRVDRSPSSVLKPSLSLSDDSILMVVKAGLLGRMLKLMLVP